MELSGGSSSKGLNGDGLLVESSSSSLSLTAVDLALKLSRPIGGKSSASEASESAVLRVLRRLGELTRCMRLLDEEGEDNL